MRRRLASLVFVLSLGSLTGCFAGVRVYDGPHGDYHRWNDREERAYRVYLADQHRDYREFNRLERPEQDRYWSWRHDHRDADLRRP